MFHVDSFKAVTFHVIGCFSFHLASVHMRDEDKYLSRILLAQADYFGGFRSPLLLEVLYGVYHYHVRAALL